MGAVHDSSRGTPVIRKQELGNQFTEEVRPGVDTWGGSKITGCGYAPVARKFTVSSEALMQKHSGIILFFFAALLISGGSLVATAQVAVSRISQQIEEYRVVTLAGNLHPVAMPEYDQGAV